MKKKQQQGNSQIISELKPLTFGQSMNKIIGITGKNVDFSSYAQSKGKLRYFTDEKGVFKEMGKKEEKGKVIVSE